MNTDRFKFRVYDPDNRRMIYIGDDFLRYMKDDGVHNDTQVILNTILDYWFNISPDAQITLMQCTGRKDSKGNLVYEGDILADATGEPAYVIKWRKAGFCGASVIGDIAFAIEGDFVGLTVLGNIYENPELLEKD